ncbi:MAG: glycosyltransferase family 2 protein [Elusimicrobiota bacterium]
MKFSIVTISYNQARFIESAIKSVIQQRSNINLEYIVVDANSTDSSIDIIKKYENQIDRFISEPDLGPADGLNKGFSYATGDIWGYLNADDILEPGALKRIEKYFSEFPQADIIAGHCHIIDQQGKKLQKCFSHYMTPLKYLRRHAVLIQQSTFFRRTIFEKVGGFNVNNDIAWDGELIFEMLKNRAKLKIVNDILSSFRLHPDSISGKKSYSPKLDKFYLRLYEKNKFTKKNNLINYLFYILHWLTQPSVLYQRLIDQLQHPKRII